MSVQQEKPLVVLHNVSKRYRQVVALDNVSLSIEPGEIFGYIGPNGAGKTTTIKILVGLITDFQGQVTIAGQSRAAIRGRLHKILGYLPQEVGFQEWRTVEHALTTFGLLSGLSDSQLQRRIAEVLDLLYLTPVRRKKIAHLSGGMVQKLGLAQALLHNPPLLVLDEPLAGLDPASRHHVKAVICELRERGTTIIFSSHILSDVQDIATRVGILHQGRIRSIGALEELQSRFGVGTELEIQLSRDSGGWRELASLAGVQQMEETAPQWLRVRLAGGADLDEAIHRLLVGLIDRGCRVRSLNPVMPSLDQVYLQYVSEEKSV